jgi:C1A family cysteine protease
MARMAPVNRIFGWRPDKPDIRDRKVLRLVRSGSLPENVDLRTGMPPVYDQGSLGSCTGNAIAGAIEYMRKKEGLPDFVPSRLFIYYNERTIEGTVNSDAGAEIRDGIKTVANLGACSEVDWPYDTSKFTAKPTDQCYSDAKTDLVTAYSRVDQTVDALRVSLASGIPVVFGFTVYESFESDAVAKSGLVPMPGRFESSQGGHAVLMCGYDDDRQLFQVRNSWGPNFGDAGYVWMPYDYITNPDLASDFWQIDVVSQS